jgi:hypothetical protein
MIWKENQVIEKTFGLNINDIPSEKFLFVSHQKERGKKKIRGKL